jgi:chitin-binding protein
MKIVLSTLLSFIAFNELAVAHGTLIDPVSRVYQCRGEGPESPTSAACIAAGKEGVGPQQFYDWSAVAQGGANSDHKAVVPDGMLCSGGNEKYAGLDLARSDWKATSVTANEPYTFKFFESAPHQTKYFKYYITKDSYDLNTPLKWDDLELLCQEGASDSISNHEMTCTMPDKVGN